MGKRCKHTKKWIICSNLRVLRDLSGIIRVVPDFWFPPSLRGCLYCFGTCCFRDARLLSRGGVLGLWHCGQFRFALYLGGAEVPLLLLLLICFVTIIFLLRVFWFRYLRYILFCIAVLSFPFAFARLTRDCRVKSVPYGERSDFKYTWSEYFGRFLLSL
jgi:hypothetical protein